MNAVEIGNTPARLADMARNLLRMDPASRRATLRRMVDSGLNPARLPILRRPRAPGEPSLASHAQQRLWFLWRLDPQSTAYHVPAVLRLTGHLDVEALQASFDALIRTHEQLRTVFRENAAGVAELVTVDSVEASVALAEAGDDELQGEILRAQHVAFDLTCGPLVRATLIRRAPDDHWLVLVAHHIVCDGWSMRLLMEEFQAHYAARVAGRSPEADEVPLRYTDYADWQREWLETGIGERQLSYWRAQLAGDHSPLRLAGDLVQSESGTAGTTARYGVELSRALVHGLRHRARTQSATLFMVLLAALDALLYRYTGRTDIRVGVPNANRNRPETERLVGFFVNTQILRCELNGADSLIEVLQRVRRAVADAQEHQDLPFEQLVQSLQPDRSDKGGTLFEVMFNHEQRAADGAIHLPGLVAQAEESAPQAVQCELTFNMVEDERGSIRMNVVYARERFSEPYIARLCEHYQRVLLALVEQPQLPVRDVSLLGEMERSRLRQWGDVTARSQPTGTLHGLIEQHAKTHPDAEALRADGEALRYGELNRRSNRLAHRLIALGVRPESRIGIAVRRSADLVIGLLAILKAGAAYVPLDPEYPSERLRYLVQDSDVRLVLTDEAAPLSWPPEVSVVRIDDRSGDESEHDPHVSVHPSQLAYVIYTSGSTGRPKGAQLTHRNVLRLLESTQTWFGFDSSDVWTLFHSYAFDFSVWEIFGALCHGGRLVVVPREVSRNPEAFLALLKEEHVTVLNQTPSAFRQLMPAAVRSEAGAAHLRYVIFGGEALDPASLRPWIERFGEHRPQLINMYGITETTVHVTFRRIGALDVNCSRSPLGERIPDLGLRVLDADLNPVPPGVPGELHVSGDGLARGYLKRAALTAERFVADPDSALGERLYRTGDLVRWNNDGELDYVRRIDAQVKIRGHRIELGEISARLMAQAQIGDAAAVVKEGPNGARLVAYIVPKDAEPDLRDIRRRLAAELPAYMVPAAIVSLERLPLNENGKLDRHALPDPQYVETAEYEAPAGELEHALASVWCAVLALDRVGRHDNFFELGGDSIRSLDVVARARNLDIDLSLRQVFEHQVLSALAEDLAKESAKESTKEGAAPGVPIARDIPRVDRGAPLALSPAQSRQWFLWQLDRNSTAYHVSCGVRIVGDLDVGALRSALAALVHRHESLRTVFHAYDDGVGSQLVQPARDVELTVTSVVGENDPEAAALERTREFSSAPFDLIAGAVFRAALIRIRESEHLLILVMHHIATDGWSMQILLQELVELYRAARTGDGDAGLKPLAIQYVDHAQWQLHSFTAAERDRQLAYWRETLGEDAPILQLQTDHPRAAQARYRAAHHSVAVPAALARSLSVRAREHRATLFMTLVAGFQALLHRHSGQHDIRVGMTSAGRADARTRNVVGLFVNTQVLRAAVDGRMSLSALLEQARAAVIGAQAHQELPFEELVDALQPVRSLAHAPLFQVLVNHQREDAPSLDRLPGLTVQPYALGDQAAQFELVLNTVERVDGSIGVEIVYAAELFEPETIARLADHYVKFLSAVAADPQCRIDDVPVQSEAELDRLQRWSRNARSLRAQALVHELVEQQARDNPETVAIVCGDVELSYADLDRRANRLARRLRASGVTNGARVGLAAERGLNMVVGLLAILKAGGAYVPLDAAYPAERLSYMMRDSRIALLLTQEKLLDALSVPAGLTVVPLEDAGVDPSHQGRSALRNAASEHAPDPDLGAPSESVAYVLYTSGSTGQPKGVAVSHRAIVERMYEARFARLDSSERILQYAPLAFDASTLEVWGCLCNGGTLVQAPPGPVSLGELATLIESQSVTTAWLTAALCNQLIDHHGEALSGLRQLISGGEAMSPDHARRAVDLLGRGVLINGYGPTEATTFAACHTVRPEDVVRAVIPLGRPLDATDCYVLDESLGFVPAGVAGELYIGGGGLAQGYENRTALTAERFVANPFSCTGERLYRSGDRIRWNSDGHLEYLGRIDRQLKIRGFRIEPGEVEAQLLAQPDVQEAVVLARETARGTHLVAYVVPSGAGPDVDALRERLAAVLPDYMVPTFFVMLERLPLNASGKVDRRALPEPADPTDTDDAFAAPEGEAEQALARIWADVLGIPAVGRTANFFELGGDSILSLQIVARARTAGWKITPRQMFERQTIARLAPLAERIGTEDRSATAAAAESDSNSPVPLLPIQAWFFEQSVPNRSHWNQSILLRSREPIDAQRLAAALAAVVRQHAALRFRFTQEGDVWHQMPGEPPATSELLWVRDAADASEITEICAQAQRSLDLTDGPLLRAVSIAVADGSSRLFLAIHHLVIDGVSWRILLDDLQSAYRQLQIGSGLHMRMRQRPPVQLPPGTASYRRWTCAMAEYASHAAGQLTHWEELLTSRIELPCDDALGSNLTRDQVSITLQLDRERTAALLKEVPAAYRTHVNDVLLTALARALGAWTGYERVLIDLENHGREATPGDAAGDLDLSRTVGWFTNVHPLLLDGRGEIGEALKRVKEALRRTPDNGLGYGALRYRGLPADRARLAAQPSPQIAFNYLGQFDNDFDERADWLPAAEAVGPSMDDDAPRTHDISINGQVYEGALRLDIGYSAKRYRNESIQAMVDHFERELHALIAHCTSGANGVTPSDFPLAKLTQATLDALDLSPAHVEDLYPMTMLQQGLLFQGVHAEEGADTYVNQLRADVEGLDVERFRAAWQIVLDRHEILRTGFLESASLQWVAKRVELPLVVEDCVGSGDIPALLDACSAYELRQGFDFVRPTLMRLRLIRTGARNHHFIWTRHHVLLDGWSTAQLIGEVLHHYAHGNLPPLRARYRDYIQWLQARDGSASQSYWKSELSRLSQPTRLVGALPAQGARAVPNGSVEYTELSQSLDANLAERLLRFAKQERVTLNTLVQGAWAVLLSRYTGERCVTFGSTTAGRPAELAGVEQLVGLFINTFPVIVECPAQTSVGAWLRDLQAQNLSARDHEYTALHQIQRWGRAGSEGLFDTLLVFENYPVDQALRRNLPGSLRFSGISHLDRTHYPMTVSVVQDGGVTLCFSSRGDCLSGETTMVIAEQLRNLLEQMASNADRRLGEIELSETSVAPQPSTKFRVFEPAHVRISRRAAERTVQPAIHCDGHSLTYKELDRWSDAIAARLRSLGVGTDKRVGLCVERSPGMVAALLGILKSGGAFVPLDPTYPAERLAYMIDDSQLEAIVTDRESAERCAMTLSRCALVLLDPQDASSDAAALPAAVAVSPDQLAYVIYTSGSTGMPKGVAISHGALSLHLDDFLEHYAISETDKLLHSSTINFDVALHELLPALMRGGQVQMRGPRPWDLDTLSRTLRDESVTFARIPTAFWQQWLRAMPPALPGLRQITVGGEALPGDALGRWFQGPLSSIAVDNLYGPTETTVACMAHRCTREDTADHTVPIGKAYASRRVRILDTEGNVVPLGALGELCIAGDTLARGYLDRPGLTAQRFIADPAGGGARLYRSGDLCRQRADGVVEFLGRLDQQVKLRGHRIELGEIEMALRGCAGVREAVVELRGEGDRRRLVGYVAGEANANELRMKLQQRLPDYMVPAALVVMAALPLNPNGKVDRQALPEPSWDGTGEYEAPQGPVETALASVWTELLALERVGRHDNFFELGGDSILSLQIVSRARMAGWKITPRQMFEHQTVAHLAAVAEAVDANNAGAAAADEDASGPVPLLPIQARFFEQSIPSRHHWNQTVLLQIPSPPDASAIGRALQATVAHHDAFRMRYATSADGQWEQRCEGEVPAVEELLWIRRAAGAHEVTAICSDAQRSLHLSDGPLLRAVLIDVAGAGHRLLLVIHHLVVDGVSWRILLQDLRTAWNQALADEPIVLPARTADLRRWARYLDTYAQTHAEEHSYWERQHSSALTQLPCDFAEGSNLQRDQASVELRLEASRTRALLTEVPAAYRTQINDVLVTALARALSDWSGADRVLIDLEGHGREVEASELDLSRTVGWLTSLYPVSIEASGSPGDALKRVKETLRAVPNRGLGYGAFRYRGTALQRATLAELPAAQVMFNYLGQLDTTVSQVTTGTLAAESPGDTLDAAAPRAHELSINGQVLEGELRLTIGFSARRYRRESVEALAERLTQQLEALIDHCATGVRGATPSDFPLTGLAQAQLDALPLAWARVEDLYPMTPLQQGLLFHSLSDSRSHAYVNQLRADVDDLDIERFRAAWQAAFERHAILRTGFFSPGDISLQWVAKAVELPLVVEDEPEAFTDRLVDDQASREALAARLDRRAQAERAKDFDFAVPPLMRLLLIRTGTRAYHFIWTRHHALMDGWAIGQLIGEVLHHYRGHALTPLRGRYRDYIQWLRSRDARLSQVYWTDRLKHLDEPTRLTNELPEAASGEGYSQVLDEIDPAGTQRLIELARQERVTVNTLVQAAWALLLSVYTGRSHVTFGATTSGRPADLPAVEQLVGLFINTLPVTASVRIDLPIGEWLRELQSQNVASREHEHTPLYEIQRWAGRGGQALFDTLLVFENYPVDAALRRHAPDSLRFGAISIQDETHYPLTVAVEQAQTLTLRFSGRRDCLTESAVERLAEQMHRLLDALVGSPRRCVGELLGVEPEQRALLDEWGTGHAIGTKTPVHELIERSAARHAERVALKFGATEMSYAELDRRSNRLAHRLIALGVKPETRVGICLRRSPDLIVGLLGILKAGGAYVPLDPDYPDARLAYMAEDSGLALLLSERAVADRLPALPGVKRLWLDERALDDEQDGSACVAVHEQSLAYVLYTSGSTGQPKGVQVCHGALSMHLQSIGAVYGLTPEDRLLQFASLSFDAAGEQWMLPLLVGATIVLAPDQDKDFERVRELVSTAGVSVLYLPPAYLRQFVQSATEGELSVRLCVAGGEAWSVSEFEMARRVLKAQRLVNAYGPTETVITPTAWVGDAQSALTPAATVPIGTPVGARSAYVLDGALNIVPVGVGGELYLGGEGMARGYLDRPAQTSERFVANPFGAVGDRLYRTGDRVRWTAHGELEYLGRLDDQVKVRGLRIETGEIEAHLRAMAEVLDAAVVARETQAGAQLVAYLVCNQDQDIDANVVRTRLASIVPSHMVPSVVVFMEKLPLSANGKTDRKALPEPDLPHAGRHEPPEGEIESALALMWSEILGVERVGRGDDFFALGGHSLAVLRLQALVRARLRAQLPLGVYFEHTSLLELARRVQTHLQGAEHDESVDLDAMSSLLDSLEA